MKWLEMYRCVFDAFMVVWFFRPLKEEADCPPPRRTLYFVLLLCTAPIYVIPGGGETAVALFRFGFRTASYTGRSPSEPAGRRTDFAWLQPEWWWFVSSMSRPR